jgi:hypothetical protein
MGKKEVELGRWKGEKDEVGNGATARCERIAHRHPRRDGGMAGSSSYSC